MYQLFHEVGMESLPTVREILWLSTFPSHESYISYAKKKVPQNGHENKGILSIKLIKSCNTYVNSEFRIVIFVIKV